MPSSTIDQAINSTKSLIESFTSSDNPTTTFTEHTVSSVQNSGGIMTQVLSFISHPKFKWYILGVLLCIVAFIYFKFQNRKIPKQENLSNDTKENVTNNMNKNLNKDTNVELEERDKLWINKFNDMKQQFNSQLAAQVDINTQLVAKLQNQQMQTIKNQPLQGNTQGNSQGTVVQKKEQNEQLSESTNSEEIFIEDKNVMEHNLTAEEMNAIDKQLEDVNLEHLMRASE